MVPLLNEIKAVGSNGISLVARVVVDPEASQHEY